MKKQWLNNGFTLNHFMLAWRQSGQKIEWRDFDLEHIIIIPTAIDFNTSVASFHDYHDMPYIIKHFVAIEAESTEVKTMANERVSCLACYEEDDESSSIVSKKIQQKYCLDSIYLLLDELGRQF